MKHISLASMRGHKVIRRNQYFSGFSLIEVVVSSAIVATVVGALFAIASMTIRLTVQSQQRLVASELAREGLEAIRQIRDINFTSGQCGNLMPSGLPRRCNQWHNGILTAPDNALIVDKPPFPVRIAGNTQFGFQSTKISLASQNCSDYIVRNLETGVVTTSSGVSPPSLNPREELYCRRIFIEPVNLPDTSEDESQTQNAFRVRSQVAWLGFGRNSFSIPGDGKSENKCNSSTEWCLEETSLLTNWRPVRL
jgi:Tfp pilus assembly protein FimT